MDSSQNPTFVVGLVALAASAVMVWRASRRQREVPEEEKARQYRRFTRRRYAMSVLVGIVGAALVVGALIPLAWCEKHPFEISVFWLAVIVALILLLGLCVADIYAVLHAQISAHFKSDNWAAPGVKPGPKDKPR